MKSMKKLHLPEPEVDLKHFHFRDLTKPQYRHFLFLLFWPVYYLRYFIVEAVNPTSAGCYVMHCALDDLIPLCEYFLIPYALWMVFMVGMHLFTLIYDVETGKKYSKFLIIAFSVSTLTFLIFPTCQNLRPESFERSNLFTWILGIMYQVDTNTNVCPSEHVIGALAVLAAAANCKFRTPGRTTVMAVTMLIVIASTVFLKQHSVLDIVAALPVCLVAYLVTFGRRRAACTAVQKPDPA